MGVNLTETVQLAPDAKVAPHVVVWPKSAEFAPVKEITMLLIADAVAFVSVTVCAGLAVFSLTVPKFSDAGSKVTDCAPCAAPGDILTTNGVGPLALSVVWKAPAVATIPLGSADPTM